MMKTLHLKFARMLPASLIGGAITLPLLVSPVKAASFSAVPVSGPVVTVPFTPEQFIQAKASTLGAGFTGTAVSGLETVPGGFRIRYQKCDIYYSAATGAHEVHGDIRAKYNAKGGPLSHLGLPRTDELTTSDGIGRYSEFSFDHTAIYWSPNTGPFEIGGALRSIWVANGAESGWLGYPTAEVQYQNGGEWAEFQNGPIYLEGNTLKPPEIASLKPERLTTALHNTFVAWTDDRDYATGERWLEIDNFSVLGVSNTGYDFWQSRNRLITVRLEGHYRVFAGFNAHYILDLRLLFFTSKEADGSTSLRVALDHQSGIVDGTGDPAVKAALEFLQSHIVSRFASPVKLIDVTIPAAVPPLSFKVLADGGIRLDLQPGGGAPLVRLAVQLALNKLAQ